jgi:hypothetical protein
MAAHHCRITQAAANALCNALVDLSDVGGAGTLKIYTGTEPANCDAAAATLVATCVLPNPAFGAAAWSGGDVASKASLLSTATDANATGNASAVTHFRLVNNAGTPFLQGTCSATAGDDLVLNNATITAGSVVDITALNVLVPINQA